ncbi:MAG: hypothetical protein A3K19_10235 [Lentisphaerae bacterium RIFOXYB12_FULL_65_16]|nr:MAG: hypothetical protein A3K18_32095 [Lentisphaerae bacterium RIFOXYA12_64_32]OGV91594.1 MAG: hypothetical protein A3K19_10235 [Lentisphaerae bacterium RIFOXYB12_FULL_65_16]
MPNAPQQYEKRVRRLKELFQLDQPDLDFGIYRIMHAKAGEVSNWRPRRAQVNVTFGYRLRKWAPL